MALTVKGTITASIPNQGVVTLTYTDVTTGESNVTSKILVITDCNGVVLDTISMGTGTVATYNITADAWFLFTLTIVDDAGTSTGANSYVSIAFYQSVFAPLIASIDCDNDTYGLIFNASRAELYKNASLDEALFGQGVVANNLIIQANYYVTSPYYA